MRRAMARSLDSSGWDTVTSATLADTTARPTPTPTGDPATSNTCATELPFPTRIALGLPNAFHEPVAHGRSVMRDGQAEDGVDRGMDRDHRPRPPAGWQPHRPRHVDGRLEHRLASPLGLGAAGPRALSLVPQRSDRRGSCGSSSSGAEAAVVGMGRGFQRPWPSWAPPRGRWPRKLTSSSGRP